MTYKTFTLLVAVGEHTFHLDVVAVDFDAATADVACAYSGARVLQWSVK